MRARIKVIVAAGNKRAAWIAEAQGWGRVTGRVPVAVRRRATEPRIVMVEAETILVTAKFKRTIPRETLAPSEAHQTRLEHKPLVRGAHPAGPLLVAAVRAVEDVGDD